MKLLKIILKKKKSDNDIIDDDFEITEIKKKKK